MKLQVHLLILLSISIIIVSGKKGFGPTDQEWGFITIREKAHMFWWLHYTTAKVTDPTTIPLIIWLQGGPGGSSSGYGNFGEIGPLNEQLVEREYAWTKKFNVLFVDNPVGSGFSYVDDKSALVVNNSMIADDFLVFMQNFYNQLPKFENTPLYIFCESYGGKMTAEIGLVLYEAIKKGKLTSNFKGVGLGDSWISPIDSVLTWGPYLLNQGLVDEAGYKDIQQGAEDVAEAISNGKYDLATTYWFILESKVDIASTNVNFYNILTKAEAFCKYRRTLGRFWKPLADIDENQIYKIMNNEVRKALDINREWISQSSEVFSALETDFMKPVTDIVEKLLNETDLEVVIYNGQLDLIVDTPGTVKWVNAMKWKGSEKWKNIHHSPVVVNGYVEGFYKTVGKLTFYWVSRAGHMVPYDNPLAMDFILTRTTNDNAI